MSIDVERTSLKSIEVGDDKGKQIYNVKSNEDNDDGNVSMRPPIHLPPPGLTEENPSSLWKEVVLFLHTAVPLIIVGMLFFVPSFWTASVVGRWFGYEYLAALMLALLTVNLVLHSILMGMLMAADSLQPQAYAVGNYRQVGVVAIRTFFWCMVLILPMTVVLWFYMKSIYVNVLGQDDFASTQAWYWYRIFSLSLPFNALFLVVEKFLNAQAIMWPPTAVSMFCTLLIFPVALHYACLYYGFVGSAVAFVVLDVTQPVLLLLYVAWRKPHTPGTWPGLKDAWRDAISWEGSREFLVLGFGGILTLSEWIFWEALGLVVGTMGVFPLSVHAIPCQVIDQLMMLQFGVGQALALHVAATIPLNVRRAQYLAWGCQLVSAIVFGLVSLLLYYYRYAIYSIFTNDQDLIDGCDQIWWMACLAFWMIAVFEVTTGITTGLGLQWFSGAVTVIVVWLGTFPALVYLVFWKHGDLVTAWYCIWSPYVAINGVLILYLLTCTDWYKISASIQSREGEQLDDGRVGCDFEQSRDDKQGVSVTDNPSLLVALSSSSSDNMASDPTPSV